MCSSFNPKLFAVRHIYYPVKPSSDRFHTGAALRQYRVLSSSDHHCIETVAPSGNHCGIDTVLPSSEHCYSGTVPPSSDHYSNCTEKMITS